MERGLVGEVRCTMCLCNDVSNISNLLLYVLFTRSGLQNPLCAKACKRDGTIKTSFCASEFGELPVTYMSNK